MSASAARRFDALAALALAAAAAAVFLWQHSRVVVLSDFSYIIENAWRIAQGDAPYADFVIPHAPLTFLIQGWLLRLSDGGLWATVAWCSAGAGLTTLLTLRILRGLDGRTALPFLLAAPIVCLNGFAILAQPFYDSDAVLFLLMALAALMYGRRQPAGRRLALVLGGALLVLPVVTKQNIGLAALAAVHGALILSALVDRTGQERRSYLWVAIGSAAALAAAAAIVAWSVGLGTYFHWTVEFAAARRWPSAGLLLSPYVHVRTWTLAAAALGAACLLRCGRPWMTVAGLAILAMPLVRVAPTMVRWGMASRIDMLWGAVTICTVVAALARGLRRDGWTFERMLPIVSLGVAHAAFASQGVNDSAYAVWPLFVIALAPLAGVVVAAPSGRLAWAPHVCVSAALIAFAALGWRALDRHERLQFADVSGSVEVSRNPRLGGLATGGAYLPDFDRLVARTHELIPQGAGIAVLPGEDPFFLATGRRPRVPVVFFDDTTTPYDRAALLALFDARGIEWVIVKRDLQLRHLLWSDFETFVNVDLAAGYAPVDRLPRYTIYRRTPK